MKNLYIYLLKPKAWVAILLLSLLTAAFFTSGLSTYLIPIRDLLNSDHLSFKIGEMRFSTYLILKAAFFVVIIFWVLSILSDFAENRIKKLKGVGASNKALILNAFQSVLYFGAFLFSLNFVGIDLTAFAVLGGAIVIGIGLGLKNSFKFYQRYYFAF
ncbi:MAG: small-conductance mechanosensitive channel [Alphaproteobacteria bacterium]|jgi:small-conductance mechanosensitive channel